METSASHSLPTPRKAWIPWASLRAPRGPVVMDVWTISSTSLGSPSILSETPTPTTTTTTTSSSFNWNINEFKTLIHDDDDDDGIIINNNNNKEHKF